MIVPEYKVGDALKVFFIIPRENVSSYVCVTTTFFDTKHA